MAISGTAAAVGAPRNGGLAGAGAAAKAPAEVPAGCGLGGAGLAGGFADAVGRDADEEASLDTVSMMVTGAAHLGHFTVFPKYLSSALNATPHAPHFWRSFRPTGVPPFRMTSAVRMRVHYAPAVKRQQLLNLALTMCVPTERDPLPTNSTGVLCRPFQGLGV
jgi:hypothetical protein